MVCLFVYGSLCCEDFIHFLNFACIVVRFKDLVHPLNTETRAYIQNAVLAAYAKERLF